MSLTLAPGTHRPVSGLGGVRALAGLGCGCANQPVGSLAESKGPLIVLVAGTALVVAAIIIREAIR